MPLLDEQQNTKQYWRSLDQLADKPAFQDWMSREFPAAASELPTNVSRRRWLQLMGAALSLGGIAGCRWEAEEFAPFTIRPQNRAPGEKQFFATSWELSGVARPLTATSIDGRPIKIEGNTQHPATSGGTSAFDQAMILSLYDPDRRTRATEQVRNDTVERSWEDFDKTFSRRIKTHAGQDGRGLAILCESSSSETRSWLRDRIAERFGDAIWCEVDGATDAGVEQAFGQRLRTHFDFNEARIIACFDSDPLGAHPDSMRLIRDWADRREPNGDWMNRLYSFESHLSLTGSNADHRCPVKSGDIADIVARLETLVTAKLNGESIDRGKGKVDQVLAALADDLANHKGQSLLTAGPQQSAEVHARIHRLNETLGNHSKTIVFTEIPKTDAADLAELIDAMDNKRVETLLILDVNAAYGLAESTPFREAMTRVPFAVHAGLYNDETAALCRWHVPMAHPLESWSDGRSFDGTISLSQPLISPLFAGRTQSELLSSFVNARKTDAAELVRSALTKQRPEFKNEKSWRRLIHDGFIPNSARQPITAKLVSELDKQLPLGRLPRSAGDEQLEVVISSGSSTYDGRFANNAWLQETPDAISKLTWDNAAAMSPATAKQLGVTHGDVIQLAANNGHVDLPVFELPGVALNSIQLAQGYGRTAAGHVGGLVSEGIEPIGVDVSALQSDEGLLVTGVTVTKTGRRHQLATTQDHFAIDTVGLEAIGARVGELIRTGTLSEYEQHPDFASHRGPHHPPLESLWEEPTYEGHAWGMSIDLNRCIGCTACSVACQSENNVPIVGKEQVLAGREMHWLRMDRYFAGDQEDPEVAHQPVACHHCETAPCEQVCPVAATVHSDEGLNDMVYNRCIGTRYCANNCPYKVRRFNFLDYNAPLEEPKNELVQLVLNPEVTVRSRGVMEKCTYCVQRIQSTKIDAKNNRRSIDDGEIQTACQQACPAQAIVFGDLNDPNSAVAKAHADDRAYGMLAELNTKPRTKYLAKIRNPHPWLANRDSGHSATEVH